jgi:hypothetical protein
LLKEAGVEANPAFMIKSNLFSESIGSLMDVEDILVKTEQDGNEPVYLSVSILNPQNLLFCSPDKVFVDLGHGNIRVEKSHSLKNKIRLAGTFTINEKNQLSGEVSLMEDNGSNPYLMLLRDKNKAKSLFGGGLTSSDLKDPGTTKIGMNESSLGFTVQKEKPFRIDSNYYFLQLPVLTNGIESLGIHLLPKDRTTPLELSSIIDESNDFTFVLPGKMKPFIPNEKMELKNNAGSFSYEVQTDGQNVVVHKSLKLEKRLIQPEEYPELKALMDHWNADRCREVVLIK